VSASRDPGSHEITRLLGELRGGRRSVVDSLMPLVYDHLHAIAQRQLRSERANHTLSATALVHEAYLKLVDQKDTDWKNRAHFLAIAARAMRRILINYANARLAEKRGGGGAFVTLDEELLPGVSRAEELVQLDAALEKLRGLSERQSQVVEYRFFGGLTQEEIAEVIGMSVATVRLDWRLARAWLSREMRAG